MIYQNFRNRYEADIILQINNCTFDILIVKLLSKQNKILLDILNAFIKTCVKDYHVVMDRKYLNMQSVS